MSARVLEHACGPLVVMRPPVPAPVHQLQASFAHEQDHLAYSPRSAYGEWLAICDAIVNCGGDVLFEFESVDDRLLDVPGLHVDASGVLTEAGSRARLGHVDDVMTGRVLTANGPWVTVDGSTLSALMPNKLAPPRAESTYYRELLIRIADASGYHLQISDNPHPWEGMADVAVAGDHVLLMNGAPAPGDPRARQCSSRIGSEFAADYAGVPAKKRIYLQLRAPHVHGDSAVFVARSPARPPHLLVHPTGFAGDVMTSLRDVFGADRVLPLSHADAVTHGAASARQIGASVLVSAGVSEYVLEHLGQLKLACHTLPTAELYSRGGGGPGRATLHLPGNLTVPQRSPLRYSQRRVEAKARRGRLPERLTVEAEYFQRTAKPAAPPVTVRLAGPRTGS